MDNGIAKEKLRVLINSAYDETVRNALWELYELKFMNCMYDKIAYPTSYPTYKDYLVAGVTATETHCES